MAAVECIAASWNPRRVILRYALVGVCLIAPATGCNWWLRITEVTGTVRIDGKPASGVQVVFEPMGPSLPRSLGMTNRDGTYRLRRQGPGKKSGAAAGRYRIEVMSDTERENPVVIPATYNSQSSLQFEVVPGKTNIFDIDITSK